MKNIIIADDEPSICKSLGQIFRDEGYRTETFSSLSDLERRIEEPGPPIHLVLLDIWFKEDDGISFLARHEKFSKSVPIVMMSGHGTIETAVKATKLGAYDFIEKPISYQKLGVVIERAFRHFELKNEHQKLRSSVIQDLELVGESDQFNKALDLAFKAAKSESSVLIQGDNGTGKELFSRLIHKLGSRSKESFVSFNCAAVPEGLIESELFGYEKGAFTGAIKRHSGKFEQAHKGILFLDEVGDMPLSMQAKLLRVLQEKKITRLGGSEEVSLDVRVIGATNKPIERLVERNQFRSDLFYRINVIPIWIPSLNKRKEDIPDLLGYFSSVITRGLGVKIKSFSEDAIEYLKSFPWPGNVRQLRNFVERVVVFTDGEWINKELAQQLLEEGATMSGNNPVMVEEGSDMGEASQAYACHNYKKAKLIFEKNFFEQKIRRHQGNMAKIAEEVELERSHLYKKLKKLGVKHE
jgi:two-component system nitrogen regulation response regulator NtrX